MMNGTLESSHMEETSSSAKTSSEGAQTLFSNSAFDFTTLIGSDFQEEQPDRHASKDTSSDSPSVFASSATGSRYDRLFGLQPTASFDSPGSDSLSDLPTHSRSESESAKEIETEAETDESVRAHVQRVKGTMQRELLEIGDMERGLEKLENVVKDRIRKHAERAASAVTAASKVVQEEESVTSRRGGEPTIKELRGRDVGTRCLPPKVTEEIGEGGVRVKKTVLLVRDSKRRRRRRRRPKPVPEQLKAASTPSSAVRDASGDSVVPSQQRVSSPPSRDYIYQYVIGQSDFSKLYFAQKIPSRELFVIKVIPKANLTRQTEGLVFREKEVLQGLIDSPFVIRAHSAFSSDNNLHVVVPFARGGCLEQHLEEWKQVDPSQDALFRQSRVRFYAAELFLAIRSCHESGIVHMNICPKNILIGADGHVLLTGFDVCRVLKADDSGVSQVRGKLAYMSPEMVQDVAFFGGSGFADFGPEVDWWAFGVVLAEMLLGCHPFESTIEELDLSFRQVLLDHDESHSLVRYQAWNEVLFSQLEKLFKSPTRFPDGVDLLTRLLCEKSERLDPAEIELHPFFQKPPKIDWDQVRRKRFSPPFVPSPDEPFRFLQVRKLRDDVSRHPSAGHSHSQKERRHAEQQQQQRAFSFEVAVPSSDAGVPRSPPSPGRMDEQAYSSRVVWPESVLRKTVRQPPGEE